LIIPTRTQTSLLQPPIMLYLLTLLAENIFFFSSRRRHTRSTKPCSDLPAYSKTGRSRSRARGRRFGTRATQARGSRAPGRLPSRSGERGGGKEGRWGWWGCRLKEERSGRADRIK